MNYFVIRQYNPKKRGRFGVESFILMDSEHKYVLDILPYQGKTTPITDPSWITQYGFGGSVVLTLLQNGYLRKNHRLILDNYFQSPRLAKTLVLQKTYVLGTVRKDRKFMPKFTDPLTNRPTKMKKGDVETYSDGDLLLERWGDRREVLMLNSFIDHRMEDCESRNPTNQRLKPASVLVYNKVMGSLDDMDQIIRPYQALRKSKKWYRKYAFHIFDICIYNTFVISGHFDRKIKKQGYKAYLIQLVKEIVAANPLQRAQVGRPPKRPALSDGLLHLPQTLLDSVGKKKRSNCHLCTKNKERNATPFKCERCGVWLCVGGVRNCFSKYHV